MQSSRYYDFVTCPGKGINLEKFYIDAGEQSGQVMPGPFMAVFTTGLTTGEIVKIDRGVFTRGALFRALAMEYDQCWIRDAKRSGPICHRKNITITGIVKTQDIMGLPAYSVIV